MTKQVRHLNSMYRASTVGKKSKTSTIKTSNKKPRKYNTDIDVELVEEPITDNDLKSVKSTKMIGKPEKDKKQSKKQKGKKRRKSQKDKEASSSKSGKGMQYRSSRLGK